MLLTSPAAPVSHTGPQVQAAGWQLVLVLVEVLCV